MVKHICAGDLVGLFHIYVDDGNTHTPLGMKIRQILHLCAGSAEPSVIGSVPKGDGV